MAIEIDSHDTERLIREISAETGESADELISRKRAFFAELDARPVLDGRDWREIEAELYDEHGQPIG